ncbi:MAG TPA: GNAT family N-acetyltransferase [Humisphaera sp.]
MSAQDPDAVSIRPGTPADVPTILALIRALAEYEQLLDQCVATEAGLRETLFGDRPAAEVLIARVGDDPVGFALFFPNYSTFLARPGVYLEDIFVRPEHRRRGIGKMLFREVAKVARARGAGRLEWAVLDWNAPSIAFYKGLGAVAMDDWTVYRMTADAIAKLADG